MNLLFAFSDLPWWAWAVAAAAVIILIVIIVCAAKGKKKKSKGKTAEADKKETKSEPVETKEEPKKEEPVKEEPKKEEPKKEEPKQEEKKETVEKKEEPAEKSEKPATEKKESKPVLVVSAKKTVKKPSSGAKSNSGKVYHISKRKEDGKWQIKAAGATKALKLFDTQAEAIAYAKTLAENQDARIMIHKEDGSFRKLTY